MRRMAAVWEALGSSLKDNEDTIISHITKVHTDGKQTGIERIFAESFKSRISDDFESEVSGSEIGVSAHFRAVKTLVLTFTFQA